MAAWETLLEEALRDCRKLGDISLSSSFFLLFLGALLLLALFPALSDAGCVAPPRCNPGYACIDVPCQREKGLENNHSSDQPGRWRKFVGTEGEPVLAVEKVFASACE